MIHVRPLRLDETRTHLGEVRVVDDEPDADRQDPDPDQLGGEIAPV